MSTKAQADLIGKAQKLIQTNEHSVEVEGPHSAAGRPQTRHQQEQPVQQREPAADRNPIEAAA